MTKKSKLTHAQRDEQQAEMLALIAKLQANEKARNEEMQALKQQNEDLVLKQQEDENVLVEFKSKIEDMDNKLKEMKTKETKHARGGNKTSKGQKFSKNENTGFDLLVWMFQNYASDMQRIFDGKTAEIPYSDVIEFMQTEDRKAIGDAWGDRSTYINWAHQDWNPKTGGHVLGRKFSEFGFYTNKRNKGKFLTITKMSVQLYCELKNACPELALSKQALLKKYVDSQSTDEKMSKEEFVTMFVDLKQKYKEAKEAELLKKMLQ